MLSIVVPVYNAAQYLRQCIGSILKQSYKDIELILVDNNSTDDSVCICQDYERTDNRVKVLKETKRGSFYARKKGVLEATGDYITFVDADDFISEDSYKKAVSDMENGIEAIFFDIYRYFSNNQIRYDSSWKTEGLYDKERIVDEIFPKMLWNKEINSFGVDPTLCCKIITTNKLKKIYLRIQTLDFYYGEDVAIIYPLLLDINTISIHNEAYYFHRQRVDGDLPGYVKDDAYLEKLYKLYMHLKVELAVDAKFQEQIDLFYIKSVELAKKKYSQVRGKMSYLFPFDKVEKDIRIIVYGAGNVGSQYMEQLRKLDYCQVVLWVDKSARKKGVTSIEDLKDCIFDKIVVAIENPKIREDVKQMLIKMDINEEKIVF